MTAPFAHADTRFRGGRAQTHIVESRLLERRHVRMGQGYETVHASM